MVSVLESGLRGLGSSPGQGRCVEFLGKTLNTHISTCSGYRQTFFSLFLFFFLATSY